MRRDEEEDHDTPAPTLLSIIRDEGLHEQMVSWRVECLPSSYWKWIPYTYYSYKGRPWGYREGIGIRWLGVILRIHGRFHTW